jgi:hypothetical protein
MAARDEPAEKAGRPKRCEKEGQIFVGAARNRCVGTLTVEGARRKDGVQHRRLSGVAFAVDAVDGDSVAQLWNGVPGRILGGSGPADGENATTGVLLDQAVESRACDLQARAEFGTAGGTGAGKLAHEPIFELCPVVGHVFESIYEEIKLSIINILVSM